MTDLKPDQAEEHFAGPLDDVTPSHGYRMLPLASASAGSAGSIARAAGLLPLDAGRFGMAFVVVIHLSAAHESALADLIQRTTHDACRAGPRDRDDRSELRLRDSAGEVAVGARRRAAPRRSATPFRPARRDRSVLPVPLADTYGPHATAIVLSGADGDGAIGIRRVQRTWRPVDRAGPARGRTRQHAALGDRDRHRRSGAAGRRDGGAADRLSPPREEASGCPGSRDRRCDAAHRTPRCATRPRCAPCST